MGGLLLLGLLAGLLWGIARAGPAAWVGTLAALLAFGSNPDDPLSALIAFVLVFFACRWIGVRFRAWRFRRMR